MRGTETGMTGASGFGYGRRQSPGRARRLKANLAVGAIAERFVLGMSAAAQADGSPAGEVERVAVHIVNGKVSLDANRAVVADSDFRGHFSDRSRSA